MCLSRHIQFSLLQVTLLHSFIVLAAKMTDILFHYFSALFWMLKAHIHSKWIEAFFITASSASPQFTCSTRSLLLFLETLMLLTLRTIRTLERGKMEEFKKIYIQKCIIARQQQWELRKWSRFSIVWTQSSSSSLSLVKAPLNKKSVLRKVFNWL